MELLGENVWSHAVVLFTFGDWLGDMPIEQFIYSEGPPLKWVVEKCALRYLRINNNDRADITQVAILLERIKQLADHMGVFQLSEERHEAVVHSVKAREMAIQQQQAWGVGGQWGAQPVQRSGSMSRIPPSSEFAFIILP
ncbi:hypothetical protein ACEWY4_019686 [Coilia grayii]|uniref:AIG1-type G domain-containing protein n=1 Tax=Coilia grayii TaxID=363190 RepID=A0ABD1JDM3_9TELE